MLAGLIDGWSAEKMCEHWVVSITTVRSQIRAVLAKLGVRSQLSTVAKARSAGCASDTISFEWRSTDVGCGGGAPRVFVRGLQASQINTHDFLGSPAQCGTAPDADGWRTVSMVLPAGFPTGPAGDTGIVADSTGGATGVIEYRNVVIGGKTVVGEFNICDPSYEALDVNVPGPLGGEASPLCYLSGSPILVVQNVAPNAFVDTTISLSLRGSASNVWANKVGTADLIVIATQAGQAPANQADQSGSDA